MLEQPYEYAARELVEPDWRRLPGFADATEEQWRSAQWQRVNCVKNLRQLRGVYGDLLDESFYADVEEVAVDAAQLAEVLDAVDALPLGAAPLLLCHVREAGQPAPVGLDELTCRVLVGLFEHDAASLVQRYGSPQHG